MPGSKFSGVGSLHPSGSGDTVIAIFQPPKLDNSNNDAIDMKIPKPALEEVSCCSTLPRILANTSVLSLSLLVGAQFGLLAKNNSDNPLEQYWFFVTSAIVNAIGTMVSIQDAYKLTCEVVAERGDLAVVTRTFLSVALMLSTVVTSIPLANDATKELFANWFQDNATRRAFEIAGITIWQTYNISTRWVGADAMLKLAYQHTLMLGLQPEKYEALQLKLTEQRELSNKTLSQRFKSPLLTFLSTVLALACLGDMPLLADTSDRGFSKLRCDAPTALAVIASLSTLMFFMRANYLILERMLDAGEGVWKACSERFNVLISSFFLLVVGVIAWGSSASWGSEARAFVHPQNGTEPSSYLGWVPETMRSSYEGYSMYSAGMVPNANFVFALMIAVLKIQKDYGVSLSKAFVRKVFPRVFSKSNVDEATPPPKVRVLNSSASLATLLPVSRSRDDDDDQDYGSVQQEGPSKRLFS